MSTRQPVAVSPLDSQTEATIAAHGWAVRGVVGPAPFSYTIGLHSLGLPELILFGASVQMGGHVLNDVVACLQRSRANNEEFLGKKDMENWQLPIFVLPVPQELVEDYACAAIARSEGKATYLQVCLPDPKGLFPWQPGFDEAFRSKLNVLSAPH